MSNVFIMNEHNYAFLYNVRITLFTLKQITGLFQLLLFQTICFFRWTENFTNSAHFEISCLYTHLLYVSRLKFRSNYNLNLTSQRK